MAEISQFTVEVAYATSTQQHLITVEVEPNSTIETVIDRSGIIEIYPEIDLATQKVGIFSQPRKLTDLVKAGDRIEIYRPLSIDPKEARKKEGLNAKTVIPSCRDHRLY